MSSYIVFYRTKSVHITKKYPEEEVGSPWADDHNRTKELFSEVKTCEIEAYSEGDAYAKFQAIYQIAEYDKLSDLQGNDALIKEVGAGTFIKAIEV